MNSHSFNVLFVDKTNTMSRQTCPLTITLGHSDIGGFLKNFTLYRNDFITTLNDLIKSPFVRLANFDLKIRPLITLTPNGDVVIETQTGTVYATASTLTEKLKPVNPYEKYVGKIISFTYNAGSKPRTKRVVRVTSVTDTLIHGVDVELPVNKDNVDANCRNFKIKDIAAYTISQISA